jgi:hypothetical protein
MAFDLGILKPPLYPLFVGKFEVFLGLLMFLPKLVNGAIQRIADMELMAV